MVLVFKEPRLRSMNIHAHNYSPSLKSWVTAYHCYKKPWTSIAPQIRGLFDHLANLEARRFSVQHLLDYLPVRIHRRAHGVLERRGHYEMRGHYLKK